MRWKGMEFFTKMAQPPPPSERSHLTHEYPPNLKTKSGLNHVSDMAATEIENEFNKLNRLILLDTALLLFH
jgi:hypothetical protein